jgi:hypothetical protein
VSGGAATTGPKILPEINESSSKFNASSHLGQSGYFCACLIVLGSGNSFRIPLAIWNEKEFVISIHVLSHISPVVL